MNRALRSFDEEDEDKEEDEEEDEDGPPLFDPDLRYVRMWTELAHHRGETGKTPWNAIRDRYVDLHGDDQGSDRDRFEEMLQELDTGALEARREWERRKRRERDDGKRSKRSVDARPFRSLEKERRDAEKRGEMFVPPVCSGPGIMAAYLKKKAQS